MTTPAWFYRFAAVSSQVAGSAWMFVGSLAAFGLWLVVGPFLHWDEMWHLFPTSLLTWTTWFLVVLIQNAQQTHEVALQRKMDELIRAIDKADNRLIGLEKQPPPVE